MTDVQYTLVGNEEGGRFISVFVPGRAPLVADETHPSFDEILAGAQGGDAAVIELFDAAVSAANRFERITERVSVSNGRLFFDGDELNNSLSTQVVRFLKTGVADWKPLVSFFENVQENVNEHSRTMLYDWLAAEEFTITDDGMIVGYKGVYRKDGGGFESTSSGQATVNGVVHTGRIPQEIGDVVEMPRSSVAHNPAASCSTGLHVGTSDYANGFGDTLLEVIINPRDVVSVPSDAGGQKMRVCRYRVSQIIKRKVAAPVVTREKKGKTATAAAAILKVLGRRKKQGLDAAAIADKAGLKLQTARTTLSRLQKDGLIKVAGVEKGTKGAEVNLYLVSSSS